ncbi:MAG: RrF2 family transcriptional regulator [Acidimicrobiia bacterium]
MKIVPTRRTDYGIRALIYLANEAPNQANATEIATAMGIPKDFLHQVLQDLIRAGLVRSRPGRGGGYALVPSADAVTILEIVEALEGPLNQSECALRGGPCHWEDVCALHSVWSAARQALIDRLSEGTLQQIADDDRALQEGRMKIPADSHRR